MVLQQIISKLTAPTWPDAKPLPAHVRDMRINHEALALHIKHAASGQSDNTQCGYGKKVKQ